MTRYPKGFTLLELMVVLTILAIIVSVAFPSFQDIRDRNRARAAAESVFFYMQFARSESVKQDRNLFVRIQDGANWCLGISNATDCDCNTDASCQFGPAGALAEQNLRATDFSDITLSATQAEVAFDSRRGTIPALPNEGVITIAGAGGNAAEVRFSSRGRIRLCGDIRGYPACN